ncbi:ABC-type multidrug transport system fused ATPase/permease subunit [Anaerotaenia torta]|uniref:ABC transporter transmembrane domain-containing protein n=1 Tax=Anaerotaenia torta TaxID=433293 RepID=UPI003D21F923
MKLLKKLIFKRGYLSLLTIGISAASIGISLCWNAQLSEMINAVNSARRISLEHILIAVVIIIVSSGMAYTLGMCSSWCLETICHDLRMGYAAYFTALPLQELEERNVGRELSKLQNEMNDVSVFLRSNLFTIIDDLVKFIGTFSWMLWKNPRLTLLVNLPTLFLLVYTVYSSRLIGKTAVESQQANTQMNGFTDTLITVFPVLKLFDAASLMKKQYREALDRWQDRTVREERRRAGLMSLSAFLSCLPLIMLFLIGGRQVIRGAEEIGTFYVFINLSGNVSGVMMNMPGRIAGFRRFAAGMKRLESSVLIEEGGSKS